MLVTASPGVTLDPAAVLATMRRTLARWQLPDDVVVVDALPLTATGKIDKKALRVRFQDHLTAPTTGSLEESA